jgi:hypothetical protein
MTESGNGEDQTMEPFLNRLAWALALGGALLAAAVGAWQNLSVLNLALRSAVVAGVIFAFARLGGELAGRSLLRGLAEHQLKREEAAKARAERSAAAAEERKAA